MWYAKGKELATLLPRVRGRYTSFADLSKTTWFQVGGPAEVVFKPADIADLSFFLKEKPAHIPVCVIGVGSNLLVRDQGVPGVVIRLGKGFNSLAVRGDRTIDVGAGVLDRNVAMMARDEGVAGLEFLCGVPGTIGGAIRMNAGCYGTEIQDILECAFVLDTKGRLLRLTPQDLQLSYRHSGLPEGWIVVGARFKGTPDQPEAIGARIETMLAQREDSQPIRNRTGGSTFANPEGHSAWKLIDAAGCRGLRKGGAQVSELHCNFLINTGDATAQDLEDLGELVRHRVFETSGIDLRWEIQRIGWNDEMLRGLKKAA